MPEDVLEEFVNEAMCIVVMMRRPIVCEEHLMGAFGMAVRLLIRHHREGRGSLRVGSRPRVDFETVAARAPSDDPGPDEIVELRDSVARAADFIAQLDEFERRVVSVMATRGLGAKLTAGVLGVPVRTVRAAERSARSKLDRVAVIAAAGRMCDFRERAIVAYARGSAAGEDERLARAHLAACAPCRRSYARMAFEMRGRDFRRGAAAAFLPAPAVPFGHHFGVVSRLLGFVADRVVPAGGPGERVVEVLGGAGVVKVAATGGAVVVATATLATGIPTLVMSSARHAPHRHHSAHASGRTTRHTATTGVALDSPVSTTSTTARSSIPMTQYPLSIRHLTPRQHAELEFASLRSPGTTSRRKKASVASAASTRESSAASVSGSQRGESSGSEGKPAADSGSATQAAREFGQP
jgi:hypothetical protein